MEINAKRAEERNGRSLFDVTRSRSILLSRKHLYTRAERSVEQ